MTQVICFQATVLSEAFRSLSKYGILLNVITLFSPGMPTIYSVHLEHNLKIQNILKRP